MTRLIGKVALVTGAGRHGGLGEAICSRLGAEGAQVVVTDLGQPQPNMPADRIGTTQELASVVARLRATGVDAIGQALDVQEEQQVEQAVALAVSHYGRLDILINNAGIGYLQTPLLDGTPEMWRDVLGVNLIGAFLCIKHAAKQMVAQGEGGRIVSVASQAAKVGSVHLAPYVSSKHGLVGLTRSAAMELAPHGITVNAVCPNHVTTGLGKVQNEYRAKMLGQTIEEYLRNMIARIPLGRVGLPEDTAKACAFLCSDDAAYITGEAMNVSGGAAMH
ncbi:MAG TPA: SDR family NAD(P)-dependent oxidoreductase [Steroidobacteraceae bacterium]|nr:SDR family NAD(P)-dependent oxidoreductase [Steroidobacteraceae bacterium]